MVSVRNLCYDRLRSRRTKQEKLGMLRNETDNAARNGRQTISTRTNCSAGQWKRCRKTAHHHASARHRELRYRPHRRDSGHGKRPTVRVLLSRARKRVRERFKAIMDYGIG